MWPDMLKCGVRGSTSGKGMIYRVTFIRMSPKGPKLETITHSNLEVIKMIHDALKLNGVHVRLWMPDNTFLKPQSQVDLLRHFTPVLAFTGTP
jgi:hypothetical protein